jgi:hypothetical protein
VWQGAPVTYESGATVVLRDFFPDGRIRAVECGVVVADDEQGTMVWVGKGSAVIRRSALDGRPTRDLPIEEKMRRPTLPVAGSWDGFGVLILTPPGDAGWSVWWFYNPDGLFDGWYVNLQTPARRWWGGLDLEDQALDVVIGPDRDWRFKDENEFRHRTGLPLFWSAGQAEGIRTVALGVIARAESGEPPFDGRWCDFRPDPAWPPTALPWWWDLPRPAR